MYNAGVGLRLPRRALRSLVLTLVALLSIAWIAAVVRYDPPVVVLPELTLHEHAIFRPAPAPAIANVPLVATAYCSCVICCGRWADGFTASGTRATEGRTLAADPSWFSAGTCLALRPDIGTRIVEDTGSAIIGGRVDVYFESHQEAIDFGVQVVSWSLC